MKYRIVNKQKLSSSFTQNSVFLKGCKGTLDNLYLREKNTIYVGNQIWIRGNLCVSETQYINWNSMHDILKKYLFPLLNQPQNWYHIRMVWMPHRMVCSLSFQQAAPPFLTQLGARISPCRMQPGFSRDTAELADPRKEWELCKELFGQLMTPAAVPLTQHK